MTRETITVDDQLYDYILDVSLREPPLLEELREETARMPASDCQISPEQGQFMAFLVKLIGARRTLEVGVFTGYSALWVAQALPEEGQIVACDISEAWTAVARRYWKEAGVDDKIELHLAPAAETLNRLIEEGQGDSFDFAFIDADKAGYDTYYEQCLTLLRPGGLIAIDNVLRDGRVIHERPPSEGTRAIQRLNRKLHTDPRIDLSLVPIADGLTLARKR
jgi:predicted O-methyltransferase YrrM